jgi:hypothetical protein
VGVWTEKSETSSASTAVNADVFESCLSGGVRELKLEPRVKPPSLNNYALNVGAVKPPRETSSRALEIVRAREVPHDHRLCRECEERYNTSFGLF